jgi:hypothetical protein
LTIGNDVKNIDDFAFQSCSGITKIEFTSRNTLPTWTGKNIFSGFGNSGTVVSTNGTKTSEELLTYAKGKGLNNNWTVPSV